MDIPYYPILCIYNIYILYIFYIYIYIYIYYIFTARKTIFSFARRPEKIIFLKKKHGNMIFSSNFLKRCSFQKGPRRHMIFLVSSGKTVFFSRKNDIFSLGRKWEAAFFRKYMEIWHFLCTRTGVTNVEPRPSVKKNQIWSYPEKIHLKVIDVLDWHPRKNSSNSLYFHGDLYRRFHALLSSEKKQET